MSILEGLNDRQYEAASHLEGPQLIIAGAGSGKTRVLTHRIAYMIKECGIDPFNIMAITFTNKAAGEMRERVDRIVGEGCEAVWVMTFHATCVRILRRHIDHIGYDNNFTIYDSDDSKSVMREVFKKLNIDTKYLKEATAIRAISNAKDECLGPNEYAETYGRQYDKREISQAYEMYQKTLKDNNALDFDDLIRLTVALFKRCPDVLETYQNRFKYIMVDEYQDTNDAQFELVRLLASKNKNLCVVGDDDQSIYKFRGANIKNILNFEEHFPGAKVVKLEQNYRSTQNILNAANAVIKNNRGRKNKQLWTERDGEELVHFNVYQSGRDEASEVIDQIERMKRRGVADFGDFAILYRTNAQSREFEEQLVRRNIPYYLVGGVNFYSRREIKDLLAYLKTIDNARDDLAVKRIINVPKRSIGPTTVEKIMAFADSNGLGFFDACALAEEIPGLNKAAAKVSGFVDQIVAFRECLAKDGMTAALKKIIADTGYYEEIRKADEDDAEDRLANIDEMISTLQQFENDHPDGTLSQFLEDVALVSDLDNADDESSRVLLMTIHSAKGLEFPIVFLCGMEDGVFPGYMSINSGNDEDIEEERRLAYVAITRAKDILFISAARGRMVRGETSYNPVSRFVREIPEELLSADTDDTKGYLDYSRSRASEPERYASIPKSVDIEKAAASGLFKKNAMAALGGESKSRPVYEKKQETVKASQPVVLKKAGEMKFGKPDYEVGDRVRHVKFGEGTVLAIEKGARDYQVTVNFDAAGQKIMYAGFAKLQKC